METVSDPDRSRIRTLQVESCEQTREIWDDIFSSLFERLPTHTHIYIYIYMGRDFIYIYMGSLSKRDEKMSSQIYIYIY